MNVISPGIDGNRTNWTPPHIDFPHYMLFFLSHLGPFPGAYLWPPTPNLSPVCVIAQARYLSRQIALAPKHLILFGGFGTTPLQGWTALPLVHDPYLHASCVFVPTRWIPDKTPRNHFQCSLPNVFQTFSRA